MRDFPIMLYLDFTQFLVGFAWDHTDGGVGFMLCLGVVYIEWEWRD